MIILHDTFLLCMSMAIPLMLDNTICILYTDINECVTNNGGCSQTCTNTPGSRVCSCSCGFILASNGRVCIG